MSDDERDELGYRLRPYPDQLRLYLDALRVVLKQTGPKGEPPGFAAALAAGERWTDGQVLKRWIALDAALDAYPGDKYSPPADRWHKDNRVWFEIDGPLERSLNLLMTIGMRWKYPSEPWKTRFYIRGGTWILKGSMEYIPIVPPVLEPAEHETLSWAHRDLEDALANVPEDELGEPPTRDEGDDEEEPGMFAPTAAEDEVESEATATAPPVPGSVNLVLGEPGDRPLIWGQEFDPLRIPPYTILQTMLKWPTRKWTMTALATVSGYNDAPRILRNLCKQRPEWLAVVHLAGGPHGRFFLHQCPPSVPKRAPKSLDKTRDTKRKKTRH